MMQRKKLKLLLASLAASTILFAVPMSVVAVDGDTGTGTGGSGAGGGDSTTTDPKYSITNSCQPGCKHEFIGSETHTIKVMGGTHTIIFTDVKMDFSAEQDNKLPALEITRNHQNNSISNVTLVINGENTLKSPTGCAGIRVTSGNFLTITGPGNLTAEGGANGAGIGNQGLNGSSGEITLASEGTITAKGGDAAAGIGGGQAGGCGKVTIKSGTVNATGGKGYTLQDGQNTISIGGGDGIGTGGE